MAKTDGRWLILQEMLEQADPQFIDELRAWSDADRLAHFAASWYQDRRPQARRFLLEYLKLPLNAYRHEPLVKRLFKLAEKNGDDEVMAHFLVLLDRSVRRKHGHRIHWYFKTVADRAEAERVLKRWSEQGAQNARIDNWGGSFHVQASIPRDRLFVPVPTTMPRGIDKAGWTSWFGIETTDLHIALKWQGKLPAKLSDLPEPYRSKLASFRLFSVHTRNYLRRRVWRYFRKLGKEHPERYIPAITKALRFYDDNDARDGVALLDNWSLMHVLFHHSPVLRAQNNGWTVVRGRGLDELAPAPIYPHLWAASTPVFFELLKDARCRVIRQWALFAIRQNPGLLKNVPFEELFRLLNHEDAEIATLAAEVIAGHPELSKISVERWLNLLTSVTANALDAVCSLAAKQVPANRVPLDAMLKFACSRPLPLARLGFRWLQAHSLTANDLPQLWRLTEAQADPLRAELVRWARKQFSAAANFQSSWVLDFLDSRHAEVRAEGWNWLMDEARAHNDVELWQKLLESPYDDLRLRLVEYLHRRYDTTNALRTRQSLLKPDLLRLVWASVLLNIHRGGRSKPRIVQQVVERMEQKPDETVVLLPLLKVLLRSVRGPEWRAGLAGIVQLLERQPEVRSLVEQQFPELQMASS